MSKKTVTQIIIGGFVACFLFDLYLYADGHPGNSISQVIIDASEKSKLVPAFIGFLFGSLMFHFFDNYKEPRGENADSHPSDR